MGVSCSGERRECPRHGWEDEAGTDVCEWREATEPDPGRADAGRADVCGPGDDGGITVAEGIGDGAGGGSSNCRSSTGGVERWSGQEHLGYGVASSKTGIPSSAVLKNTNAETLTRAWMQSVVQFASILEYSPRDMLYKGPSVVLRDVGKLVP